MCLPALQRRTEQPVVKEPVMETLRRAGEAPQRQQHERRGRQTGHNRTNGTQAEKTPSQQKINGLHTMSPTHRFHTKQFYALSAQPFIYPIIGNCMCLPGHLTKSGLFSGREQIMLR
jgi:hypothetical protein